MGACTFVVESKGSSAQEAFRAAVDQAKYDHGHSGYTGTIAEKDKFTVLRVPDGVDPGDYADTLMANADPRIEDKWGPAGCVRKDKDTFIFFGWASS